MLVNPHLDQISWAVREIPIMDVVSSSIEIKRSSWGEHFALCPFHKDSSIGSFMINESKGYFRCWSCGKKGDGIALYAQLHNISYYQAKLEIARDFGIIDNKTYNRFSKNSKVEDALVPLKTINTAKSTEKMSKNVKHPPHILHTVYSKFLESCELSDFHRKHLVTERGLDAERIRENLYKSNKQRTNEFMENFRVKLQGADELKHMSFDEILSKTPGFYQKKVGSDWQWFSNNTMGILIPIRDEQQQITGIQIRLDKRTELGQRYYWFSSSFADNGRKEYLRNGTGSGVPLDVVYPNGYPSKTLFITEGHFKARAIADIIGAVAISVQGVGNYRGIEQMITLVSKEIGKRNTAFTGFSNICVAFDSDMQTNKAIYANVKAMSDLLKSEIEIPIFYLEWDKRFKGIDDLLLSKEVRGGMDYRKLMKASLKEKYDLRVKEKARFDNKIRKSVTLSVV